MVMDMKKIIGITVLLCSLLVGLVGCGNSDVMVLTPYGDAMIKDEGASSGTSAAKATETEQNTKAQEETVSKESTAHTSDNSYIGFAQVGSESDWRMAQTASMKETFKE